MLFLDHTRVQKVILFVSSNLRLFFELVLPRPCILSPKDALDALSQNIAVFRKTPNYPTKTLFVVSAKLQEPSKNPSKTIRKPYENPSKTLGNVWRRPPLPNPLALYCNLRYYDCGLLYDGR